MVINSRLVRQTAWNDIEAWLNILNFELPSNATSSEVDADEVVKWSGTDQDGHDLNPR